MSPEEMRHAVEQKSGYEWAMSSVDIGDAFLFVCRAKDYITSGDCRDDMIYARTGRYSAESFGCGRVLSVCNIFTGHNGYGDFADIWLTGDQMLVGQYGPADCIIVNAAECQHALRYTECMALPNIMYYEQPCPDGHSITICSERQVATHVVGLDDNVPYNRHGKYYYRAYRNYWGGENKFLDKLVRADLMTEHDGWYHYNRKGLEWLGYELGCHIRLDR